MIEKMKNMKEQKFQFHYGTIKSYAQKNGRTTLNKFQFHYGTIKRKECNSKKQSLYLISIPLWYD